MAIPTTKDFTPIKIINPLHKKVSVFENSWGTKPEDVTVEDILRLIKSDIEVVSLYGYNEAHNELKYYATFNKGIDSLIQINSERRRYVTLCEQKIKNQFAKDYGDIFGIEETEIDETQLNIIPAFDKESYSGSMGANGKKKGGVKKSLYGFCISANFSYRNSQSIIGVSGFVILDFDDIDVRYVAEFKEYVTLNQYTYACWYSPSFEGVKALVRIPEYTHELTEKTLTTHKNYFNSIQKYWNSQFGNLKHCLIADSKTLKNRVLLDPSGNDITRVCFFNYDPTLYLNDEAKIWTKQEDVKEYKRESTFTSNVTDDINPSSLCCYEYEKGNSYMRSFPLANTISYHFGNKGYDLYRHILRKFPSEGLDSYWTSAIKNNHLPSETVEKFLKQCGILKQEKKVEIITNNKTQRATNQNDSSVLKLLNKKISDFNNLNKGIQLNEDEYLGHYITELKVIAKKKQIHLWQVPAGKGKTEMIKQLAKTHRVLVAVPTIAIIRNKFENDITYKDDFKFCYGKAGIKTELDSKKLNGNGHSIVSTFDQLSYIHNIKSIASNFDYIFIDESHELTLSNYRLKCTGKLMSNLLNYGEYLQNPAYKLQHEIIPHASLILMTGTPCGEQQLLGEETVKLTRFLPKKNKPINLVLCRDMKHTFNTFIKKLQEILFDENSLVFIPCNLGEPYINTLMEFIGCCDYMIYSKNQSETANVKFIDEKSLIPENIKVIFGTKSAGCGLDFNNTDKKVSVLFSENEISAYIEQYISRFRKVDVDTYLFVQTIDARGNEMDFDGDINKPYEYEFDETDYKNKKKAFFNSKNIENFGKSGEEMEAWNDDFVFDYGVLKQNKLENQRYTYSKMYYKLKKYEIGLKKHEKNLCNLCGGLLRLNYQPKLIEGNLLTDDEKVEKDFKKKFCKVILGKNLRLKEYFENLLPFAGISFKGWKYEIGEELKIEQESKTVTCPNFDHIKFVKRYLFKFFDLKSCEEFIRNEMICCDEKSGNEILKSEPVLENKIKFYQFCKDSKDIVVSFIKSVHDFWFDQSYSEDKILKWKREMTSLYLVNDFFELDEKTQKSEMERFNKILDIFGTIKTKENRSVFIPISDYEQIKSDVNSAVCSLFKLETSENGVFHKLEEFKVVKKKRISFDYVGEEIINEIETKMKKQEGLLISELKKMTGLDNGKEISAFMKQFKWVNKKRVRINGRQETMYFKVEL
ncbi:BT4734/BF3469 family protein [Flavobacterium sp. GP15]|uniref:BT4734/BF3469 family protein n=1 Tax=Flavobacterium sp. GP15 TaxID=2758567 RepID=UPI00165D75B0|nr:BT4734/BF3469 family protein [Flavobacterium sp. GP15]